MVSKIQNFERFVEHIRAEQTIADIMFALDRFVKKHSSNYKEGFIEEYVSTAEESLDNLSTQLLKMAEGEFVRKKTNRSDNEK